MKYTKISVYRIGPKTIKHATDLVATEKEIELKVKNVGQFTLLCTPFDLKALVIGFLYTSGLIIAAKDITSYSIAGNTIKVEIKKSKKPQKITITKSKLKITSSFLATVIKQLNSKQKIFAKTGGTHAAGIFGKSGKIFAFGEDIGRHNALDKAIGHYLLANKATTAAGVVLSSRISYEMVAKTAKAGIGLIIAVSAPTSLAIKMAKKWNIDLYGFVRQNRANCYGSQKIKAMY